MGAAAAEKAGTPERTRRTPPQPPSRTISHGATAAVTGRWYTLPAGSNEVATALQNEAHAIEGAQSEWFDLMLRLSRYYNAENLQSLYDSGQVTQTFDKVSAALGCAVSVNVMASCIDTLWNQTSREKTRVQIVASGGNWDDKMKAQGCTKFLDGSFDGGPGTDVYEEVDEAVKDAELWGTGLLFVYDGGDRVNVERVLSAEVLVDEQDGMYRRPRVIIRKKFLDRETAAAKAEDEGKPDVAEAIRSGVGGASGASGASQPANSATNSDVVEVFEAWCRGVKKDRTDGRHVMVCDGHVIFDEQWTKKRFPFAKIVYRKRQTGWQGQGLGEQLLGIQIELIKILQAIVMGVHLVCVPRTYVKNPAGIRLVKLDNRLGAIVEIQGDYPQHSNGNDLPKDWWQLVEMLIDWAHKISGVSEYASGGTIPRGMENASGEAQRQYKQQGEQRHVKFAEARDNVICDVAELMLDVARDMAQDGRSPVVKAKSGRLLEEIDFKDVNLDADRMVLQRFPTSFLPNEPGAKFQRIQELVDFGWISPQRAMALFQMPDLEDEGSLLSVTIDIVKKHVGKILEKGKPILPLEYQDPGLSREIVTQALLRASMDEAPQERIDLLANYLDELDYIEHEVLGAKGAAQTANAAAPAPQAATAPAGAAADPLALAQAAAGVQAVDPNAAMQLAQQAATAPMMAAA